MSRKKKPDIDLRYDIGCRAAYMKYRTVEDCLTCGKPKCNGCPTREKEYLQKYMYQDNVKGVGYVPDKDKV